MRRAGPAGGGRCAREGAWAAGARRARSSRPRVTPRRARSLSAHGARATRVWAAREEEAVIAGHGGQHHTWPRSPAVRALRSSSLSNHGSGVCGRQGRWDSPLAPDWCEKSVCRDLGKESVGDTPHPLSHFGSVIKSWMKGPFSSSEVGGKGIRCWWSRVCLDDLASSRVLRSSLWLGR